MLKAVFSVDKWPLGFLETVQVNGRPQGFFFFSGKRTPEFIIMKTLSIYRAIMSYRFIQSSMSCVMPSQM